MPRGEFERGIALDDARREIASRIRRVCADLDEDEFAALVDQMAEIDVRYRLRDEWTFRGDLEILRRHQN